MAKPNTYALLLQAQRELKRMAAEMDLMKGFTIQQCLDVAQIALNDEFQFGPVYNKRFERAFKENFVQYAEMCIADDKDDHDLVYTKAKFDRALMRARGDDTPEFDERYSEKNLYLRGVTDGEYGKTIV